MVRKELLLLFFILPQLLVAQHQQTPWEVIESKASFVALNGPYIDTIRSWFGVAPQADFAQAPQVNSLPPYEKMVYSLKWGAINGGYAILESDHRGDSLKLYGEALSTPFVDKFYKVRDYAYSVGSTTGLFPYFFQQTVHEKEYQENRWTLYDFARGTIYRHTGKEIITGESHGLRHNYLSLLYALRQQLYKVGDHFTLPTYVHDKSYDIRFNILSKEMITTLGKKQECYKVEPILVGDGTHGFNKNDQLFLWITAASPRVVVKIRAKARIGYVTCALISYNNGETIWLK